MLCSACINVFREQDDTNTNTNTVNTIDTIDRGRQNEYLAPGNRRDARSVSVSASRSPSPSPESPFYKATHHNLPRLKKSALDGCHLCVLLWAAAPPKVHAFWDEILRDDRPAHWMPCFFTVDRAVFSPPAPRPSSKRILVEYKYFLGLTRPDEHAKPVRRHFRLLWSEEAEPLLQKARITPTSPTTASDESWNTFKTWMWTCISQHSQCSPHSLNLRRRQLPKRLIEVGETDTVRLRTVDSIGDAHAIEYLALSHCWGAAPPRVILTSRSAAMLFEGVEVGTLCRTFRDAVAVTRRFWDEFAVRYLWIDSLCIIQDSAEDWRHESANMGDIYQNAFCTLAATAAADGDRGFFSNRDPRLIHPCAVPVVSNTGEKRSMYCVDHEDWNKNVSQSPLNGRSWVLQERLLSPRVLHFGASQLYWECSGLEASEAFPVGFPHGMGEQFKQLLPFSGLPTNMEQKQQGISPGGSGSDSDLHNRHHRQRRRRRDGPYGIWDQVMETYSAGQLSRRTDRLVALSGIARKLQRRLMRNDTYLAGLWKQDLPLQLLWDVREEEEEEGHHHHHHHGHDHKDARISLTAASNINTTTTNGYIAPSWSWASRLATVPCDADPWSSPSTTTLIDVTGATVVPLNTTHDTHNNGGGSGGDHMSQLRAGHIRVLGTLVRVSLSRTHQPGSAMPGLALKINHRTVSAAICRPDDTLSLSPTTSLPSVLYCLPILRGSRNGVPRYRGLLLVPCSGAGAGAGAGEMQFRRWGTFTADAPGDEFSGGEAHANAMARCEGVVGASSPEMGMGMGRRYEIMII
ncbi:hypothetical protein AYO20_07661 [Fonsecaea nubica]|uniref:Heterokaryon incompatibility domain-containing protein n=1 Tax=Fonsecaea nubica TaxID=856822 RepID=A0A178CSN9_9EURO|nr:hypothetical protein AYO20_07661 [Fonsecaea nubica]OAL32870.1 hypothetical protein AYO20_07661 [Fonsecaea nubica]